MENMQYIEHEVQIRVIRELNDRRFLDIEEKANKRFLDIENKLNENLDKTDKIYQEIKKEMHHMDNKITAMIVMVFTALIMPIFVKFYL